MAANRLRAWLRPTPVAIAILFAVWIAIVSVSAGPTPSDGRWLALPSVGDVATALVVAAMAATLAIVVFAIIAPRRTSTAPPGRRSLWPSLAVLALFVILALWGPRASETGGELRSVEPAEVAESTGRGAPSVVEGLLLLAVMVAAGTAVLMARRRLATTHRVSVDAEAAPRVADVVARATAILRHDDDPRSGVLGAYAEFEQGFARLGLARLPSETPVEHVARVLQRHSVDPVAVARLSGLYELARFSDHPITEADRGAALDALAGARPDLTTGS